MRLAAEWALWGKQPGTWDADGVLACSAGRLGRDDFGQIITRYVPGNLTGLPQVTVSWFGKGETAHLGLAVHEWSGQRDGMGRDIAVTRYFCVPYARAAEGRVSYEALHGVFADRALPVDGPLAVDVPALDPEAVAGTVGETVMGAAALLLTGAPVCVVNGEGVPLRDRLLFFDAVAALLPYGFRSRLTVATWTEGSVKHRIRLSFARHASREARSISWGRGAEIPPGQEIARDYHDALLNCDRIGALVAAFARETRPLSMSADLPAVLPMMARAGVAPPASRTSGSAPMSAPVPAPSALRSRGRRDRGRGDTGRGDAGRRDAGRGDPGQGEPGRGDPGQRDPGGENRGRREPGREGAGKTADDLLAACADSAERASVLAALRPEELVEAAARGHDPLTLRVVCDELVTRGENRAERAAVGAALRRRGHLVAAVERLHPGDAESQVQRHHDLLTAAYGPVLDRRAMWTVLSSQPRPTPAPLLAALMLMCEPDARGPLMEEVFLGVLGRGGIAPATLDWIRSLLGGRR
ncbi:hypothetical protein GCM10017673_28130 [Streptosporangium violaceochromogenes]|nr:hypothetical protein GCM10017673_28130 [Streptosporangium violaceochromogenes]